MTTGIFPATAMPDADWWEALWPRPREVLAALDIEPGMEVVDLCCGDGLFTASLCAMVHRVVAIDLDPDLLGLARARIEAAGAVNCDFIAGDAYDLARFVKGPVDLVLIANTFHGVPDKVRLGRAVASALRPGGRFVVVNWHRRPREETTVLGQPRGPRTELRMAHEEVTAAIAGAGLLPVRIIELPPYHYGAIFEKLSG
jgi:ubiquinone/menaquinone biosynthesis C-methylase UbiE